MEEVHPNVEGVNMDVSGVEDGERPRPRLMITKMVLENFKSYAGTKEIGPFHKCFSSVVGPNGSGKSNVIDAMLFVFGKRAKKLRLNKVSELIHKSDAVKDNPPQYARVSVHFQEIIDTGDGDEDYDIVPNTEVIVSRVANKNSSSTYKLNGKNASFKEIARFLSSKGIDLDNNRFLILQGEVEMISMMPPMGKTENDEGLLEYLEEIIGSSKFVEATNEAAEKVDALTEVRQEKLNRVKAVEKEKDGLEGAKQEAEALLEKERAIRSKQNVLYQIYGMRAAKEVGKLENKKSGLQTSFDDNKAAIVQANQRIEEIESGLTSQRKDYDACFAELKRTKEEFSAYERRDIKLREEIKHERAQSKKIQEKLKGEDKKITSAVKKREKAVERIPQLEEDIEKLSTQKAEEDAVLEKIEDETNDLTQGLREALEVKTQELAPVKQERAVLQAALDTAETELQILEDSSTRAKERLDAAETELANIDQTKATKIEVHSGKEAELQQTQSSMSSLEQEDKELEQREKSQGKLHKELLTKVEDLRSNVRASGGRGRSKAVMGIIKASRKGGELSKFGVLGRLGDLATISEEYDVAVSTACGMLDHIVVQTTAGAQKCLDFLRKHNLGRASFVPLDKQKKGAHDRAVETPEGAPRLFDLITPANFSITPALYLAVGNTLVAPDLETASRWAYEYKKRWRVVTMDGNLIETAGTMSGGGKSVRRGGMRLPNSRGNSGSVDQDPEAEVDVVVQQIATTLQALQDTKRRRREIKEELKTIKKLIKGLEIKLPKLQLEITGCDTTREELTKLIPELRGQCDVSPEDTEKQAELQSKVDLCNSNMKSCASQATRLEAEVSKLQKKILDAGGAKLKKQKKTCDDLKSKIKDTSKSLASSKVEISSSEKAEAKAKKTKDQIVEQLSTCESRLGEKEVEFKSLEEGAMEVMTAYEKVKVVEEEKRRALESAMAEAETLKKSQSEIKCIEIDLVGQLDACEKLLSENKKKVAHWEKEVAKLVEADDGFELEADPTNSNDTDEADDDNPSETDMDIDEEADDDDQASSESDKEESATSTNTIPFATLEQYNVDNIKETISTLEAERKLLAKNANMGAIEEYRKKEADYLSRVEELDQVSDERTNARKDHEELRRQRLDMFMEGFGEITLKLKEMYQMITLGGDAELELVDSLDPFSEGIVFSVRPPKKSWKNISNLSGGEKTLSSLSLVFALHHYKPTPLYVMDEIDAALDFKNVSIVANYIKDRTKNAQFIIISLRNNMFELADRLVGIYKTNNCTKSVTINPRAFGVDGNQNGRALSVLADSANKRRRGTVDKLPLADDEHSAMEMAN